MHFFYYNIRNNLPNHSNDKWWLCNILETHDDAIKFQNTRFQSNDELTRIEKYEYDGMDREMVKKEMYNNRWMNTSDLCKSNAEYVIKSVLDEIIENVTKMNI